MPGAPTEGTRASCGTGRCRPAPADHGHSPGARPYPGRRPGGAPRVAHSIRAASASSTGAVFVKGGGPGWYAGPHPAPRARASSGWETPIAAVQRSVGCGGKYLSICQLGAEPRIQIQGRGRSGRCSGHPSPSGQAARPRQPMVGGGIAEGDGECRRRWRDAGAGSRISGLKTNAMVRWAGCGRLVVGSADAGEVPHGRPARAAVGIPG
jgi:hypothetical protein